jgi:cathepsin E
MPLASGILDTGTTLVLLASDFFEAYKDATGAVLDEQTGLLKLTKAQFAQLETFYIAAGDVSHLDFRLHLSMTTPS